MPLKPLFLPGFIVLSTFALLAPYLPTSALLPIGSGVLALVAMALALVLAARWRWVDYLLGGPDRAYRHHRSLGFLALAGLLGHWETASSVGRGLLPGLADSAEAAGELAANGLLLMTAAALLRAIPYHLWKLSHMLMGPLFLLSVYHGFLVASPLPYGSTPWWALAGLCGLGILGWVCTLLRKLSPTRLVTIERLRRFDGGVDLTLCSKTPLPGFRPGQFATLADNRAGAEPHPFSIAGGDAHRRRFIISAAGDWTGDFARRAKPGDQLRLGRACGGFRPQTGVGRMPQLWVAGGVGITPFLAALQRMQPDLGAPVCLIYCVRSGAAAAALPDLQGYAETLPQLDLTVINGAKGERLSPQRLQQLVAPLGANAEAYCCGPQSLKSLVKDVWVQQGRSGYHSERFDFRGAYGLTELWLLGKPVLTTLRRIGATIIGALHASAGSRR